MSEPIVINIGALPNDGTGDPLRTAFNDVNLNFANVFTAGPVGSNIQIANNIVSTLNTNGNLVLSPNGVGIVQANSHVVPNQTRLRNLGSANLLWNITYTQYLNTTYATIGTANIGNIGTFNIDVSNLHILGGTNGYVLQTDGTGNLTWTAQTGGTGNGTPGGANTQVQYNNAGAFGATAGFTFDNVLNILNVPGNVSAGNVLTSAQVIANGEIQSGTGFFTGGYLSVNGSTDLHNANITGDLSVTGNITSNTIVGNGNLHLEPDPSNAGSYLDIFLTSGPDLHLVASAAANLILGKDAGANVMTSWNGNVYIQSWTRDFPTHVGGVWTFGYDGGTGFPTLNVQRGDNPSGTIQGQTLLFGDNTKEAIITTPNGVAGNEYSQRLVINPGAGYDYGEGGDIYLWAGRGGDNNGSGGDVKIRGGQGMADGTGGYIRIEGGDTQGAGYPGYIDITGGRGGTTQGAYVRITGGQGATNGGEAGVIGGYGTDVGGDANITAGYGGTNQGGNVNITGGGSALGLPGYGNVNVNAGASQWVFNNTGVLTAPGAISAVGNIIGGNITTGGIANLNSVRMSQSISWPDYSGSEIYEDGGLVINGPGGVYATGNIAARFEFNDGAGNSSGLYADIGNSLVYSVGNVIVRSNNLSQTDWTFDTTGNLNLPQGGWIGAAGVKGDGTMLTGGMGQIASLTSFYADAPGIYAGCFTANPDGNVNISTYGNGTGLIGSWAFDNTGNLTVPGNIIMTTGIVGSGASPAPYLSGFSSVSAVTLSASGNITGGNVSVTGNVLATNIVAEASFAIETADFNANIGGRYGVDTQTNTVTATLPASPPTGGAVFFADAAGAYNINNLIIDPNGGTIMGATGTMTVSTPNQSVGLFYNGTTWRIYNAG